MEGVGVKVEIENDSDWRVQGEVRLWMGVRSELLPGPPRPAGL